MNTKYLIKPMTCKEYANKYHPEVVEPERFCPFIIGLTVIPYPCAIQCIKRVGVEVLPKIKDELCFSCWNKPAKYHGKWIMKVKVI